MLDNSETELSIELDIMDFLFKLDDWLPKSRLELASLARSSRNMALLVMMM